MFDGHDFRMRRHSGDTDGIPLHRRDRSGDMGSVVGDCREGVLVVILKIIAVRASSQIRAVFGFTTRAVPHVREQIRMVVRHPRVDYRHYDDGIRPLVQRPCLGSVDILVVRSESAVDRLSDVMEPPKARTVSIRRKIGTERLVAVIWLHEFHLGIFFQSCYQSIGAFSRRGFQNGKIPFRVDVHRLKFPVRRKFRRFGDSNGIAKIYFRFPETDYHFVSSVRSDVLRRKLSRNRFRIGDLSGNGRTADGNVTVDLFFQTDLPFRSGEIIYGLLNRRSVCVRNVGRSPSLGNYR